MYIYVCIYIYIRGSVSFVCCGKTVPNKAPGKKVTAIYFSPVEYVTIHRKFDLATKWVHNGQILHPKPPFCIIFRAEADSDGPKA